jgi:hypothetical protein
MLGAEIRSFFWKKKLRGGYAANESTSTDSKQNG